MRKLLLIITLTTVIVSCQNEKSKVRSSKSTSINHVPEKIDAQLPAEKFREEYVLKNFIPQKFQFTNEDQMKFKTSGGISFNITENVEDTPCSGTNDSCLISVEIQEIRNISDAIINNLSTMSDLGLLESKGMFHIKMTINGEEVTGDSLYKINYEFPKSVQNEYDTYILKEIDNEVKWQKANSDVVNENIRVEYIYYNARDNKGNYLLDANGKKFRDSIRKEQIEVNKVFSSQSLGWVNLDRLIDEFETEDMLVACDSSMDYCYAILQETNSIISGKRINESSFKLEGLPVNSSFHLITINYSVDGLKYSLSKEEVGSETIMPPTAELQSLNNFKAEVDSVCRPLW